MSKNDRREALCLETAEGLSVAEIANKLGRRKDTVKRWLREDRGRKAILSKRADIESALKRGESVEAIASSQQCTAGHVRRINRELHGLQEPHRTQAEILDTFVEAFRRDPSRAIRERYVRYGSFDVSLLARLTQSVDDNPVESEMIVDLASQFFTMMLSVARSQRRARRLTCNLIQAKAAKAARSRALDKPHQALEILGRLRSRFDFCPYCNADISRREALVFRDLHDFTRGLEKLDVARSIYRDGSGHDPDGNGLGNCALLEAQILFERAEIGGDVSDYLMAEKIVETALSELIGGGETSLYVPLVHTSAYINLRLDRLEIAYQRTEELLQVYANREPSLPGMKTAWLAGQIASKIMHDPRGHFNRAERDAKALRSPQIVAIIADSMMAEPDIDPALIQARLKNLREWDPVSGLKLFPKFLKPLRKTLTQARVYLRQGQTGAALNALRSVGDEFMPRLQPA